MGQAAPARPRCRRRRALSPGPGGEPVPAGQAELAAALARSYFAELRDYQPFRSRWALRWRSRNHVAEVADALGHQAASYVVSTFLPIGALHATVVHALLQDLAASQQLHRSVSSQDRKLKPADPDETEDETPPYYGLMPSLGEMLGWLARHRPSTAGHVISEVTGQAERELGIPRDVTEQSIRVALDLDSGLGDTLDDFLRRVMTPAAESESR